MVAFTWHQLDLSLKCVPGSQMYGALLVPPTCVYTFYFFWRDFFTFGKSLVFICVRGATFFIWRDFFIWRVFYAGAWVQTLFIPYYSVMNVVSNNPINPCIPLHTLVYLHIPSRKDEVRERIPMPRLTKVSLRYYNWQIRCLCMGRWGGGGGGGGIFSLTSSSSYP